MVQFAIHTPASAPSGSQKLLQGLQEQVGFVPNLAATMAESPALLEAFLALRSAAAAGSLDPVAREVLAIAVAFETECTYCLAAHSTFALKAGAAPDVVAALRSGATPGDPRLGALARFARAVVHRRDDVTARVQDLLDVGLSRAQVLEALVALAVPLLATSVFQIAGVTLDRAFQPQAWTPALEAPGKGRHS